MAMSWLSGVTNAAHCRRNRATPWSRRLVQETVLTTADLIWPLFVTEGAGVEEPIGSLPGGSIPFAAR